MKRPPKPIRILIVDDEPPARKLLSNLLCDDPEVVVAAEARDGHEAIEAIRRHKPDLVFLDVRMPERDGFAVLREIGPAHMPCVIFVTAYDEYAVRAFEIHAVDYLVKPFTKRRFHDSLARAKEILRGPRRNQAPRLGELLEHWQFADRGKQRDPAGHQFVERLLVRQNQRLLAVECKDIDWIESADHYASIHAGKAVHLLHESLTSLETKLDPAKFVRIHRTTIVHIAAVAEVRTRPTGSLMLILKDGTNLRVSRSRRHLIGPLFTGRS